MPLKTKPSLIVGVGASAGGIQAFQAFLQGVPDDTDAAIVLVMHLDPDRPSGLAQALAPSTPLPVTDASDGMAVEAGHVYVIGANTTLTIKGGRLHTVTPRRGRAPHDTIDVFLASLAKDAGVRAVGVVLSGNASDGSAGLAAIKREGGTTFAQDQSAQFHAMPQAALETGAVDMVLPPDKMLAAAVDLAAQESLPMDRTALAEVLERLTKMSGVDFGRYKPAMLVRRVRRRMSLAEVEDAKAYAKLLDDRPQELEALLQDVLINVTSFFRDPKSFEALRKHVFLKIAHDGERAVRVWVPGCSTGEEAYSLGISLIEYLEESGKHRSLQIFATDIDEQALTTARGGVYPERALQSLGPARMTRFFTRRPDGTYEVKRQLRDVCIFARHDLTGDPPFSKLDLISCRNVLIYLDADVQRRILPVFHYALREGGFLSLGPAESPGSGAQLFEEVEPRSHVYRRRDGPPVRPEEGYTFNPPRGQKTTSKKESPLVTLQDEVDRLRLDVHAAPGIVVDARDRVLLICGDAAQFLLPAPGRPDTSAAKLVRHDLQADLESALLEARAQEVRVRRERVPFETKDGMHEVTFDIMPIHGPDGIVHLVTFETPPPQPAAPREAGRSTEAERLRSALFSQKLHHQVVMRRLEALNEELRSTQEEFLASNEEYQSTNEELETAKEELQSSYEELTTVNDQLRAHTDELTNLYSDLENIVASLQVPLLIVGPDLAIRRVADPQELIMRVIPSDIGRSLSDLHVNLPGVDLAALAQEAMRTGQIQQVEVQDRNKRWHQLRVRPYVRGDDDKAGGVIVLLDVHAQKTESIAHERARALADTIIDTSPVPLLLLDRDLAIVRANDAFGRAFDGNSKELRGQQLLKVAKGRWDVPRLRKLLKETLRRHDDFSNVTIEHDLPGLGERVLMVSGHTIPPHAPRPEMLLLTIMDETEHRQADQELERLRRAQVEHLVRLNQFKAEFIGMAAHELASPILPLPIQLKVLESGGLRPDQEEAVAVIKRSAHRLQLMVKDMMMAARFQSGHLEMEKQEVDLGVLVQAVCKDYQRSAKEQDIEVDCLVEPVRANVDEHHIERIVHNLLSNALKYTDAGGSVRVGLDQEDGHAVLRVQDTGIGLSEDQRRHLFQPFERVHTKEAKAPGTGLGLYICNGLVELHGGSMEVSSPGPGKGSTFTMRLPLKAG